MDATARPWPGTLSSRQARWSRYQRRGDTSGEASDGEKSDGEAGDALPLSATDVGGAVATDGEGSGVERGGGSSRDVASGATGMSHAAG